VGGRDGREEPTSQFHTCVEMKVIEEILVILEWGGGNLGGDHQAGCCGFSCCCFGTRDCFLLSLPTSPLRGCCGFELSFLRLAFSLVAVTVGFEGAGVANRQGDVDLCFAQVSAPS